MAPSRMLVIAGALLAALSACGSGSAVHTSAPADRAAARGSTSPPAPRAPSIPGPAPTGMPADHAAVSVIRGWSETLRRGDVTGAARYFAIPSRFIQPAGGGGGAAIVTIRNQRAAVAVNAALPCGARLLGADRRGRYVNALFRLTERAGPGGGCGTGTGGTARTNFLIRRGKIVDWIRAPDEPRDHVSPTVPGAPAPRTPAPRTPGRSNGPLGGNAV